MQRHPLLPAGNPAQSPLYDSADGVDTKGTPVSPVNDPIDRLSAAIQQSIKYRCISPNLIRRIGQRELTRRRNLKEAIKETKNTLHQIAGAYLESTPPYGKWREAMATTKPGSGEWNDFLRDMMQYHASTRERLPSLETCYITTLADIQPVRS